MTISSKATRIEMPTVSKPTVSQAVLDVYDQLNKVAFDKKVLVPEQLVPFVQLTVSQFKQDDVEVIAASSLSKFRLKHDKQKVCLGFSCGLDSVAQAVYLSKQGKQVMCFNAKGINTYENGQADKRAFDIISKIRDVSLVQVAVKKDMRKTNEFRQAWPENPIKNQLILACMLDWCTANGCNQLSLGDDFDLDIADAVPGINLTDAKQMTMSFLDCMKAACPDIKFLKIDSKKHNKLDRLKTLMQEGLQDSFYSCVAPGRFSNSYHKKNQTKYGVQLFDGNCGCSCRKCSMHNLLLHYGDMKSFPQPFVDACWKKLYDNAHSADYEFFKPELSLDQRIKNLFSY